MPDCEDSNRTVQSSGPSSGTGIDRESNQFPHRYPDAYQRYAGCRNPGAHSRDIARQQNWKTPGPPSHIAPELTAYKGRLLCEHLRHFRRCWVRGSLRCPWFLERFSFSVSHVCHPEERSSRRRTDGVCRGHSCRRQVAQVLWPAKTADLRMTNPRVAHSIF